MISFKTNIDNDEYLVLNGKIGLSLLFIVESIPQEIKDEAQQMYFDLFEYERENQARYINEISILKKSKLGKYLMHTTDPEISNNDEVISYNKIVNAFNISVFENDSIASEILPLFKCQVHGTKIELSKKYDETLLNYILEHPDFETYLQKINGTYKPIKYVVYENGKYTKKVLLKSKQKQKILSEN